MAAKAIGRLHFHPHIPDPDYFASHDAPPLLISERVFSAFSAGEYLVKFLTPLKVVLKKVPFIGVYSES